MASLTEQSLWDMGTELFKALKTGRKGLPIHDGLVDRGSSFWYDI
jgi:hypothetical protein